MFVGLFVREKSWIELDRLETTPGRSLAASATPAWFFPPHLNEAAVSVLPLSALVNLHIDSPPLLYISFNYRHRLIWISVA